ncbi:serine/threonine-protein kinase [Mycobacterium riyadhense]|uniref:serine/threonine-protein kinase n=1 Tax=Mycobacterium riyadhense TaxID=486698 RepID=UPI001EF9E74B|nr:serine/threonine-protein kinase [Mycobacterium riyadhense]
MGQQRLQPGQVFAGYRIERLLGVGGMGAVYLAGHPNLPKLVALKLLTRAMTDDDNVRARFLREADHVARLDHPNIVAVYDRGDQDGQLWIAMQYINGSDAAAAVREGPLPTARALRIVAETAKALDFAHAADMLHRDVKPANILLAQPTKAEPERVLLADFGIAKTLDEATRITATGMFTGSLQYASPEQLDPSITLDARADQYSLGCTLYHLLTGLLPYPGRTPEQWMHGHLNLPVPLVSQTPAAQQAGIPAGMDAVIQRALAKNRDHRYPNCVALAAAAQHALDSTAAEPTLAVPADTVRAGSPREAATQPGTQVPPAHPDMPRQRDAGTAVPVTRSKRKWLIASLVVLLLVAAAGAGGVLLRNVLSSRPAGAELVLTAATDPGPNPFMPPAATPPPTNTQPPPTLQPHGGGPTVATQPLPGDRDGLYGGTLNNAECDRDKMIAFLSSHPAQARAFAEALNTDPTLFWSAGHPLTATDIPTYLRELTPVVLRLDTRVTDHGFDGSHPTPMQSVFQSGTAVFIDSRGVPRARCYSGNPLTAPVALASEPKPIGAPWPGYQPGALAAVQPSPATITIFVLVDIVTGQPFTRPAGTTGANDAVRTQPVPPPQPAPDAPPGQGPPAAIEGTWVWHYVSSTCGMAADFTFPVTRQDNALTLGPFAGSGVSFTGTLNADGSFSTSGSQGGNSIRGVIATEGGRLVMRGTNEAEPTRENPRGCRVTFEATKQ